MGAYAWQGKQHARWSENEKQHVELKEVKEVQHVWSERPGKGLDPN